MTKAHLLEAHTVCSLPKLAATGVRRRPRPPPDGRWCRPALSGARAPGRDREPTDGAVGAGRESRCRHPQARGRPAAHTAALIDPPGQPHQCDGPIVGTGARRRRVCSTASRSRSPVGSSEVAPDEANWSGPDRDVEPDRSTLSPGALKTRLNWPCRTFVIAITPRDRIKGGVVSATRCVIRRKPSH
jgi:hypothetical protein